MRNKKNYIFILFAYIIYFSFNSLHGQTYTNPVIKNSSADPGTYFDNATQTYYLYATGRVAFKSKDLVNWKPINAQNVFGNLASGDLWDPVVNKRSDGYLYLNYTLNQRLMVARGTSPEGPFLPYAGPLVNRWAIGADYFKDDDGKEYLYWSEGGCGGNSGPWVGQLINNMKTIINDSHLFSNIQVGSWVTECVVEGPFMIKHKGIYYLTFTGNSTGPNYAFGYATSSSPTGPFTMYSGNPIFKSSGNFVGPGHVGFVKSNDGKKLFAVYHSGYKPWPSDRYACVVTVEFKSNPAGGPDILVVPGPSEQSLPYPDVSSCYMNQTISLNTIPTQKMNDTLINLIPSSNSGLPVMTEIASGPATIDSGKLHLLNVPGTVVIHAFQYGDTTYCLADSSFIVNIDPALKPYLEKRSVIPGTIEAENFDYGGEGLAYHDDNTTNTGGEYRNFESVDIGKSTDKFFVGWTTAGEWLNYSVTVQESNTYKLSIIYATKKDSVYIRLYFNNQDTTGLIAIPNNSSWSTFDTIITQISLKSGDQNMRVKFETETVFIDKFIFGLPEHLNEEENKNTIRIYPNPLTGQGFYIDFSSGERLNGLIEIRDVQGQLVYKQNLSGFKKELISFGNHQTKGIYFFKYSNEKYVIVRKIILK